MTSKYSAPPLSTEEIRAYALQLRQIFSYKNSDRIDVPKLYDRLALMFERANLRFGYQILPDDSPVFDSDEEGYTDMSSGMISLKESVFENACTQKFNRASFTLAHEIGHFFLHYFQGSFRLKRLPPGTRCPPFKDPEWQANTFASEFLMPFDECVGLTPEEIMRKFNVSYRAAEVRYNKVQQDIRKKKALG